MRTKIITVEIELSKQEYLMLQSQRRYVKTDFFDSDKLIGAFEIDHAQHWAKLTIKYEYFTALKKRLDRVLAEQSYENQMYSRSWKEFFDNINQVKI